MSSKQTPTKADLTEMPLCNPKTSYLSPNKSPATIPDLCGVGFRGYFSFLSLFFWVEDYMSKKGKEVIESSPYAFEEEEAKARRRHHILMQDFVELEKETESMKKRLEVARERKQILSAEVRFLRRRYKYLMKFPTAICPPGNHHPQNSRVRLKTSSKERNLKTNKELTTPSTSAVFDLNQQISAQEAEGDEFQLGGSWEHVGVKKKKLKWPLVERRDVMGSDLKQSVCRDVGNGSNRSGKRKISWQDQLTLPWFRLKNEGKPLLNIMDGLQGGIQEEEIMWKGERRRFG
ncbi:hypothetical protein ACLOJK_028371 [Asimina triloba]